jgi:hypothetical protein
MTTTVIKTIKPAGGGDYASLDDFATNYPSKDLVAQDIILVAEVYGGGNCLTANCIFSNANWTTDLTRYLIVRAASSHEHQGVWDTNKAYGQLTNLECITITATAILIESMQFRVNQGVGLNVIYSSGDSPFVNVNKCLLRYTANNSWGRIIYLQSPRRARITNNILLGRDGTVAGFGINSMAFHANNNNSPSDYIVYNCTISCSLTGGYSAGIYTAYTKCKVISENNYLCAAFPYYIDGGTLQKGTHDATVDTSALTLALRSVAYSTANFQNVTAGSEDLHIQAGSVLNNGGAYLVSQGITTDITGTSRVGYVFDIGAFQTNDVPLCWNYTARYRGSNKIFKSSGCGNYPKSLKVPSNIDKSTGRMIDDGVEIDPSEYEVI